jgi:hypothetical protein
VGAKGGSKLVVGHTDCDVCVVPSSTITSADLVRMHGIPLAVESELSGELDFCR